MKYKASLDKLAWIVTIIVTILFVGAAALQLALIKQMDSIVPATISIGLLLIYAIAFAFRPAGYTVSNDQLIIHRPVKDVKIMKSDIQNAQVITKKDIGWAVRTFGVGGLFGYYGKFANSTIGNMTWYATRRDKPVLITTADNKKIIVTPDEPEQFVADLLAGKKISV